MLNPSCANCQIQLIPHQNGVLTVEMSKQGPLAVYSTDELKCPDCGVIQLNTSNAPLPFRVEELDGFLKRAKKENKSIHYIWLNKKERHNYEKNNGFKPESIKVGPYEEIVILNYKIDSLNYEVGYWFNQDD